MNELIKVTVNENNEQLVSARDLHEFLEVSERYSSWFDRMVKYGFDENVDFTTVKSLTLVNNGATRELQDHALKLNMAKEISMIQRSEKGKEARQYFIKCEEQLKNGVKHTLPTTYLEALKELVVVTEEKEKLELTVKEQKPLVDFANTVSNASNSISVGEFAKLVNDEGIKLGQNKLFKWFRDNKYLMGKIPYQVYIDRQYFNLIEQTYQTPYGIKTRSKVLITGKGQIYFVEKLRAEFKK